MNTLHAKLEAKIARNPDTGCWVFTGTINPAGYGQMHYKGRCHFAHRLFYSLIVGNIPAGLVIDHLCRNRACVNPEHLEPVTPAENVRRGLHGEMRTHCKHGHVLEGENLYMHPSGQRVCVVCRTAAKARHRAKQPGYTGKPSRSKSVRTPRGVFASAAEAGRAFGIPASTATYRARTGSKGFSYV